MIQHTLFLGGKIVPNGSKVNRKMPQENQGHVFSGDSSSGGNSSLRVCFSIIFLICYGQIRYESYSVRGVAQSGSAPALGAGSRGFKSLRPDQPFWDQLRLPAYKRVCAGKHCGCVGARDCVVFVQLSSSGGYGTGTSLKHYL